MTNNKVFELVENSADKVILKVNAKDALTVAKNPFLSSDIEYITVTRGKNHTLTVIKTDGKTYGFNWGDRGCTMISDNMALLKSAVISFIQDDLHILLDATTTEAPTSVTIYFNSNFKKWQASFKFKDRPSGVNYWSKKSKTKEEFIGELSDVYSLGEFEHRTAQTGIDTWYANIDGYIDDKPTKECENKDDKKSFAVELIKKSCSDKEFRAKLLVDSIPEYKGMSVEHVLENYITDDEPEFTVKDDVVTIDFKAINPDDEDGYIGFTVNFKF